MGKGPCFSVFLPGTTSATAATTAAPASATASAAATAVATVCYLLPSTHAFALIYNQHR